MRVYELVVLVGRVNHVVKAGEARVPEPLLKTRICEIGLLSEPGAVILFIFNMERLILSCGEHGLTRNLSRLGSITQCAADC